MFISMYMRWPLGECEQARAVFEQLKSKIPKQNKNRGPGYDMSECGMVETCIRNGQPISERLQYLCLSRGHLP
jgi:hypothetical protein